MGSEIVALCVIGVAILLGAMSPGASFLLVASTAVTSSRRAAIAVSLGMGVGASLFAILALAGFQLLLAMVPWLYLVIKIAGGGYLLWLAFRMVRRKTPACAQAATVTPVSVWRAFASGMMTQMSNPQTALVFASIFTATLGSGIATWMYIVLPLLALVIDTLWYTLVALLLSTDKPRRLYTRYRRLIDHLSAGVMLALGVRLLIKG